MGQPKSYDELPMEWVGNIIEKRAFYGPDKEALYDSATDIRHTFSDLNDRANRLATYLVDTLKMEKGDRLCLLMRNRIEAIDLFFACGKVGIILSPLSYHLKKPELEELMVRIQPSVIVYEDIFKELVQTWNMPSSVSERIEVSDSEECLYNSEILKTDPRKDIKVEIAMNDTQMYIHTGGTTAVPKICTVPYRQMIWNAFEVMIAASCGVGGGELRELLSFPFFHIGGWNVLHSTLYIGGVSILLREFDPALVIKLVDQEKITHFGGVEAMLQFISANPEFANCSFDSLSGVTTAAAPCSPEVLKPFWEKGIMTNQAYGLTEAGPSNFTYIPKHWSKDEIENNCTKIGSPMVHSDYKIVNPETMEKVARGEEGVLCLRSHHSFDGYLNDYWRTEKLFKEGGWVYTGDLAVVDDEGLVSIVGRADNMFISGGENVSPEEIEQVLKRHPSLAGAIAVGISDGKWGQVPVALVVLRPGYEATEEELIDFCIEQLAKYKVPTQIKFAPMLPLTGAGKLDRNALKAMFEGGE